MHGADLTDFARAIAQGEDCLRQIKSGKNYAAKVAMQIYRNNYRGNLHDALASVYPVIQQLVGEDFFRLVTREYMMRHPSRSGNLNHYGKRMADFLASFKPARQLVYLPDVARLEWACHCAYFAEDAKALDLAKLAHIPEARYGELILHIHPACHLVCSTYPIAVIWHANQTETGQGIDLGSGASNALVSRVNDAVTVHELSPAEAAWFFRIQKGIPLGKATAETIARHAGFDLQTMLLNFMAKNILAGFDFP
jgi:hypothetical protein